MSNKPRIPARFSIGDVVEIESKIHRRFSGKRGVIIDREISRHTHTLDKYTVRFEGQEIETFWDIELKKPDGEFRAEVSDAVLATFYGLEYLARNMASPYFRLNSRTYGATRLKVPARADDGSIRTHHGSWRAVMTERDEHHLTEERLRQLASEPKLRPSDVEDAHIDDCSQCLGRLIELVKMFYDVGDPDQDGIGHHKIGATFGHRRDSATMDPLIPKNQGY